MRVVIAVLVAALAGCVERYDVVAITVRDPARIAVASDGTAVLPAGSDAAPVPAAAFVHDPQPDAVVARSLEHGLVVTCPHCRGFEADRVIGGCANSELVDGHPQCLAFNPPLLELNDEPSDVRVTGDTLRARYTFTDRIRGRHGYWHDPRIRLELVTPTDNVVAIRAERRLRERNGGIVHKALFGLGLGYVAAGATLLGFGIADREVALDPLGGVMLAAGILVAVLSWRNWHATDEARTIPVR